jgi:hypothetical protein
MKQANGPEETGLAPYIYRLLAKTMRQITWAPSVD